MGDARGSYAHKTMCACLLLSRLLCGLGLVQATALQHAQAPPLRPPPPSLSSDSSRSHRYTTCSRVPEVKWDCAQTWILLKQTRCTPCLTQRILFCSVLVSRRRPSCKPRIPTQ